MYAVHPSYPLGLFGAGLFNWIAFIRLIKCCCSIESAAIVELVMVNTAGHFYFPKCCDADSIIDFANVLKPLNKPKSGLKYFGYCFAIVQMNADLFFKIGYASQSFQGNYVIGFLIIKLGLLIIINLLDPHAIHFNLNVLPELVVKATVFTDCLRYCPAVYEIGIRYLDLLQCDGLIKQESFRFLLFTSLSFL